MAGILQATKVKKAYFQQESDYKLYLCIGNPFSKTRTRNPASSCVAKFCLRNSPNQIYNHETIPQSAFMRRILDAERRRTNRRFPVLRRGGQHALLLHTTQTAAHLPYGLGKRPDPRLRPVAPTGTRHPANLHAKPTPCS